jgi:hypothetical protein
VALVDLFAEEHGGLLLATAIVPARITYIRGPTAGRWHHTDGGFAKPPSQNPPQTATGILSSPGLLFKISLRER